MGGTHHALGAAVGRRRVGRSRFQPLRRIDEPASAAGRPNGSPRCSTHEKVAVTPEVKDALWSALSASRRRRAQERTLTGLSLLLQSNALKRRASALHARGAVRPPARRGRGPARARRRPLLRDRDLDGPAGAVAPVLTYLFHRLEERFDGRPTLLILDEAWLFLDNPLFAARIREWLKVLRKKNVAVVFATQSLADIAAAASRRRSSRAARSASSCPTTGRSSRRRAPPMNASASTSGRSS